MKTSEPARRILIAQVLGRTNEGASSALLTGLQDSDIRVRIAVIQSLASLKSVEALPALRQQLEVPGAKQAAETAIRQIEAAPSTKRRP